jgi:hypothetical protein
MWPSSSITRRAQPLTPTDQRNLNRLRQHPTLSNKTPLIDYVARREIKLKQEAVTFDSNSSNP